MNTKKTITHWGKFNFEGMDFYLEPESMDDELCPFTCKLNMPLCPHLGLNETNFKEWHKVAYIKDETLKVKRCLEMIPSSLKIRDEGLVFLHSKFMPPKPRLLNILTLTNALPVFIYGIDMNTDINKLLVLTELMMPRPIYFSGDPYVPFPAEIQRL